MKKNFYFKNILKNNFYCKNSKYLISSKKISFNKIFVEINVQKKNVLKNS